MTTKSILREAKSGEKSGPEKALHSMGPKDIQERGAQGKRKEKSRGEGGMPSSIETEPRRERREGTQLIFEKRRGD